MPRPTRRSVALVVRKPGAPQQVLLVKRPQEDAELPGAWGLPAASQRQGESPEEAVQRIGEEKLGCPVRLGRRLIQGTQGRQGYSLHMTLYEATLEGAQPHLPSPAGGTCPEVTLYTGWRWGTARELEPSARQGSLCSRLLLRALSPD